MEQPKLREAQFVLLQCIPMWWKFYSNKKLFSQDETQIDKNATLENLNLWGGTSLDFCWQELAQQQPVRAEWIEYFSFYVESFLERKLCCWTFLAEKTLKTKLCCFLSQKTLKQTLAELNRKLTGASLYLRYKKPNFKSLIDVIKSAHEEEQKIRKATRRVSLGLQNLNFTD